MKCSFLTTAAVLVCAGSAMATQFDVLNPAYSQQIYCGPGVGAAMAWTGSQHLLTRQGSVITEYNPTPNTTYKSTSLHGVIGTYNITNLSSGGTGMTTGTDGFIYALSTTGLQRFNPGNFSQPAVTLVNSFSGPGYGITTLPDGRIAYADGNAASKVYLYNPSTSTNTLLYDTATQAGGGYLVDGMVAGPAGHIALTGQNNQTISVITNTGALVNSFSTPHFPDGLAFAEQATQATIYSNNNDGTITRYDLAAGFLGTPTTTDIAKQTLASGKAYGDLASVGPDCAFYVFQGENGGYHGCTPGTGTHWDDATTSAESSIVRIGGGINPDGSPVDCQFYSPIDPMNMPEPGMLGAVMFGALALMRRRPARK